MPVAEFFRQEDASKSRALRLFQCPLIVLAFTIRPETPHALQAAMPASLTKPQRASLPEDLLSYSAVSGGEQENLPVPARISNPITASFLISKVNALSFVSAKGRRTHSSS